MLYISLFTYLLTICVLSSAETCTREGDERKVDIGEYADIIEVCYNNGTSLEWTYVCVGGWDGWANPNREVYCKRFGYLESKNKPIGMTPQLCEGMVKLANVDCIGNETSLTQCQHTTELDACELVSDVRCRQCYIDIQCDSSRMCVSMNGINTCACEDECLNGGFCFEGRCVCLSGYTGESCETNITTTTPAPDITTTTTTTAPNPNPTAAPPITSTITTTPVSITTTILSNPITSRSNSNTRTTTTTTTTSSTNKTANTTTLDPINTLNINRSDNATTQMPTACVGDSCASDGSNILHRIFLMVVFVALILTSSVIVLLVGCLARIYYRMRKYKLSNSRNRTLINNRMNTSEEQLDRTADIEPTYYSNIEDHTTHSNDVLYESVSAGSALNTLPNSFNVQRENSYFELSGQVTINYRGDTPSFASGSGSIQNQDTCIANNGNNEDTVQGNVQKKNRSFYHKLRTQVETSSADDDIIRKLFSDRKMKELDYIDPPYNLSELSQCIGHGSNEIALSELKIGGVLATGNFGVIFSAVYKSEYGDLAVAIKTLREDVNNDLKVAFIREAAIISQFDHPNVLRFVGIVTSVQPYMMVTELLNIELRQYLMQLYHSQEYNHRNRDKLHKMLLSFCRDIADGMEHLALKKFVHRDLAARNILVASDMSCRVADFGMSRDLRSNDFYTSKGGRIPLRWCAPEAVLYNRFSEKSDVWAYGMTLYEVWTLGCKPWQNNTNKEIVGFIQGGQIPLQPNGCPGDVYGVMIETWKQSVTERPTFTGIKELLKNIVITPPTET